LLSCETGIFLKLRRLARKTRDAKRNS
jgi:hypothetical protein